MCLRLSYLELSLGAKQPELPRNVIFFYYYYFFTLCGSVVCVADLFMLRQSDQTCELGRDWKHGQRVQQRGLSAGHHQGAPQWFSKNKVLMLRVIAFLLSFLISFALKRN